MEFSRHISRRLHEEHDATLALWGRVEATLARARFDVPAYVKKVRLQLIPWKRA